VGFDNLQTGKRVTTQHGHFTYGIEVSSVKEVLVCATKARKGSSDIAPHILNLGTR
jgi:hypothetical protein